MTGSSSRRVIPREELSDFQRWQFGTLLEDAAYRQTAVRPEQPEAVSQSEPPSIMPVQEALPQYVPEAEPTEVLPFPTAEEIEAIERQAQEEGYQTGLAAGRLAAEAEVNRLRALLGGVADACAGAEKHFAEQVLDLALVVARQFLRDEIRADRTLILPAIREAIAGLPAVKEPSRLLHNPDDLTAISVLLAGELPSDYWRFVPDPSLPSGSCRIETPASSADLTLSARWSNLLRVLARSNRADLTWRDNDPADSDSHA